MPSVELWPCSGDQIQKNSTDLSLLLESETAGDLLLSMLNLVGQILSVKGMEHDGFPSMFMDST